MFVKSSQKLACSRSHATVTPVSTAPLNARHNDNGRRAQWPTTTITPLTQVTYLKRGRSHHG